MRKFSHSIGNEPVAEASSVRKGEIFRATKNGLERLQTGELRSGGKYNRIDELPYHRITSMSYEERITTRGSKLLSILGVVLVLAGLGIPALSALISMASLQVQGNKIGRLNNALALPDLAGVSLGVYLLASRFPRKAKEGWWQIKGENFAPDELHGWQIASNQKGADELVKAVREGVSLTRKPNAARTP